MLSCRQLFCIWSCTFNQHPIYSFYTSSRSEFALGRLALSLRR